VISPVAIGPSPPDPRQGPGDLGRKGRSFSRPIRSFLFSSERLFLGLFPFPLWWKPRECQRATSPPAGAFAFAKRAFSLVIDNHERGLVILVLAKYQRLFPRPSSSFPFVFKRLVFFGEHSNGKIAVFLFRLNPLLSASSMRSFSDRAGRRDGPTIRLVRLLAGVLFYSQYYPFVFRVAVRH